MKLAGCINGIIMCQTIKENLIHGSFKYGFSMTSSMSHLEYVSKLCLYFYLPATCFIFFVEKWLGLG